MAQKILLVDDDEALTTIFSSALKQGGFEVIATTTGQDGLEKAKTQNPSLILVDQILPDMQGNQLIQSLKSEEHTKHIPIAVLSNFGQQELIKEALSQGASDYILKYQIEPQELVQKVNELLKVS